MRETVFRPGDLLPLVGVLALVLLAGAVAGATGPSTPGGPTEATAGTAAVDGPGSRGAAQADDRTTNVTNVSVVGPNVVQTTPRILLWPTSQYNLSVTVRTTNYAPSTYANLCVRGHGANATGNTSCGLFSPKTNGERTLRIPYEVPTSTGQRVLSISVRDQRTNETLATRNVTVAAVKRSGDFDSDLLDNGRETELGTNPAIGDTDRDGLDDGAEVTNYGTDPLSTDTDGDTLLDGEEVNSGTNASAADTDGDGLGDGSEVHDLETSPTNPDTDGDGLDDGAEVRAYRSSPVTPDTDDDGLTDGPEVRDHGTSPVRGDTDGDGLGDASEVRLGTDPTNPLTGVGVVALVLGAAVGGALAVKRTYGDRLRERYGPGWRATVARVTGQGDGGTGNDARSAGGPGDAAAGWDGSAASGVKTDEDRIMELLYANDGRLHQNELVEQTEWSASKVSRLLSSMAEDGIIEKIRLGRRNVVTVVPQEADDGQTGSGESDDPDGRDGDD